MQLLSGIKKEAVTKKSANRPIRQRLRKKKFAEKCVDPFFDNYDKDDVIFMKRLVEIRTGDWEEFSY